MPSNQTKAKDISEETKAIVLKRQHNRSISGMPLTASNCEFHHFVFRSQQGIGYEWNIVAITFEEHRQYHDHQPIKINGKERYKWGEFHTLMRNHLVMNYIGWNEKVCKYQKYWRRDDYGVKRISKQI